MKNYVLEEREVILTIGETPRSREDTNNRWRQGENVGESHTKCENTQENVIRGTQ